MKKRGQPRRERLNGRAQALPEGWRIAPLSCLGAIFSGGTPDTTNPLYWGGGIAWATPTDITKTNGRIISRTEKTISQLGLKSSSATIIPKQSVLVCTRATIGECAINAVEMATNQGFKNIVPHKEIGADFVYYTIQTLKNEMIKRATGSTFLEIIRKELDKITIYFPPKKERERIVKIILACDMAIEKANALACAKKRQYGLLRKKLMETCEGKELGLDQMESMGLIELGRGDIISKYDMGKAPGSYPIYSSSVKNNGVFGKYGKYMFDQELITWSVDGGGHFFHRPKHKFSVTNVCGYMKVDEGKINYFFLAACLQELHRKLTFDYQLKAHPSVIRKVYRVKIPLLAEQEKIAKTLVDAKKEIDLLKNLAEKYRAQKRGLMQQLLTGKIRVLPKNNKGGTK